MADFFGGILDSVRGFGDSVESFFDTAVIDPGEIGSIAKSLGTQKANVSRGELNEGFVGTQESGASRNQRKKQAVNPAQSQDYNELETAWLIRLRRFSNMDTSTKVGLGNG